MQNLTQQARAGREASQRTLGQATIRELSQLFTASINGSIGSVVGQRFAIAGSPFDAALASRAASKRFRLLRFGTLRVLPSAPCVRSTGVLPQLRQATPEF